MCVCVFGYVYVCMCMVLFVFTNVRTNVLFRCPFLPQLDEGQTILQIQRNLRHKVDALQKEKKDRLQELKTLQQEDDQLCVQLCATPYYVPSNTVPSHVQLKALREHVQDLAAEKVATSTAQHCRIAGNR